MDWKVVLTGLSTLGGFVYLVQREQHLENDFFVRSGPGAVKLDPESAKEYVKTRSGS